MYFSTNFFYFAGLASLATAQVQQGFNYGANNPDGSCVDYNTFANLFSTAKSLSGAPGAGFGSARLYTTVQCGTTNTPISAIQAAIDTGTSLLLGVWASGGQETVNNEIAALQAAASQHGQSLADLVVGISVGSEDLYRNSAQGMANNAGIGASAATVASYMSQVQSAMQGTVLGSKPIGHVDTWTAWILPDSGPVISAAQWLGHNSFPYFETTKANDISDGDTDFNTALAATQGVSGGKPVWVTETGWPVTGPTSGQAVASVENARTYWSEVGCELFGTTNTWWYTLTDAAAGTTALSFGIVPEGSTSPLYDLSC